MISDPSVWRTLECLRRIEIITQDEMDRALKAEYEVEREALDRYLEEYPPRRKRWWQL